jgi:hypothetical protein
MALCHLPGGIFMRSAFVILLVAASSPVLASPSEGASSSMGAAATPTEQISKAADVDDRKICKRIDATESRLSSKKLCLTAEQWKQRQEEESSGF